jgi:hypothetical protein
VIEQTEELSRTDMLLELSCDLTSLIMQKLAWVAVYLQAVIAEIKKGLLHVENVADALEHNLANSALVQH